MLPLFRHPAAQNWRRALLLGGLCAAAHAHDTISFDPNAPSQFSMNGTWEQTTPTPLHGLAMALLRADGLEIDLTMADGAAYKLLGPNQPTTGTANATTDVNDAQFTRDEPLLIARARTFFKVTNNGADLPLGSVSVELNSSRNTVFHLIYPPAAPGSLQVEMTYLGQNPPGQKDLITVLDRSGVTLASASLGVDNPSLEVTLAEPVAARPSLHQWLILIAGGLTVAVVLALLGTLRKSSPAH
jgi:hypothetical protein